MVHWADSILLVTGASRPRAAACRCRAWGSPGQWAGRPGIQLPGLPVPKRGSPCNLPQGLPFAGCLAICPGGPSYFSVVGASADLSPSSSASARSPGSSTRSSSS